LSLSLKDAQLPNETLIEVCSILPNLLHLDVSNNRKLNSIGACQMFEKLKKLRSINIQTCTAVGDVSINSLATHCGSTLEVVYMSVQHVNAPSTVDALRMFGEHCPKLHYLSLHCDRNVLCLAGGTLLLVPVGLKFDHSVMFWKFPCCNCVDKITSKKKEVPQVGP